MKIFLAGAENAVGKRVAYLLAQDKHEVTAAVPTPADAKALSHLGAKTTQIHLLNVADVQTALYGHDAVINLATCAWNPHVWKKNDVLRRAVSLSLAHGALKNKVPRFVQESAVYLYADHGTEGITEEGRWRPGPLTSGALLAERNVLELEKAGTVPVALRFGTVYSADSPFAQKILRFTSFGLFVVPGPSDGFLSMLHADDAATAVVQALTAPAGVYNVADDKPFTRSDFSAALAGVLGKVKLFEAPEAVKNWIGPDISATGFSLRVINLKFRGATGWKPKHSSPREGWKVVVSQMH